MPFPPPKIRINRRAGSVTITLPLNSWKFTRTFLNIIVDAIKWKAFEMTGDCAPPHDDAEYIESVGDKLREAIKAVDEKDELGKRQIFG